MMESMHMLHKQLDMEKVVGQVEPTVKNEEVNENLKHKFN